MISVTTSNKCLLLRGRLVLLVVNCNAMICYLLLRSCRGWLVVDDGIEAAGRECIVKRQFREQGRESGAAVVAVVGVVVGERS